MLEVVVIAAYLHSYMKQIPIYLAGLSFLIYFDSAIMSGSIKLRKL